MSLRTGTRATGAVVMAITAWTLGCYGPPSHLGDPAKQGGYGSARFEVRTEVGTSVRDIRYTLAGPNGFSRTGTFDASSGTTTATITVDRVPAGNAYQMTANATATDGGVACAGRSLPFDVAARGTALISFRLDCQEPPRTGALANLCPSIAGAAVSAAFTPVDNPILVVGVAHDQDQGPAPLSFAWSATSGTLRRASTLSPTFTCATPGPVTLTLTVSDGDDTPGCADSLDLIIQCTRPIDQVGHLVVIFLENRSFDNLYGGFPGAEGLSSPAAAIPQIDSATGQPFETLPQMDRNVPLGLPNQPFDITQFVPANRVTMDLVHRFFQEQQQIADGRMDRFVDVSEAKGLTVGYYPTTMLPMAALMSANATQTTLCDHFFHAAFGGSFLNHQWLVAAATPEFPDAPPDTIVALDSAGNLLRDAAVTPDRFVVNTLQPVASPHAAGVALPALTAPTIGDRLSEAGVDWAWYAGGWNDALDGNPHENFGFHHQPFVYYASFADGTEARAAHLKDETDLVAAIASGTLPPVSFFKPLGPQNEHPGTTDLMTGENHTAALVESLMASALWDDMVVIVTYDENGGFWDHVPPPVVDRWGPGTRVPALIFSPFAKGGVDSTPYDTTAILTLIEKRWNLAPLGSRDAAQADLSSNALRFSH